ncbi:uncharacterized protein CXQ87_005196 [Candidozyma duobushaemuli]|uniref:Uncharacterized protein n=1 Tax=Candidozyma duobushaemuli TaxID=1231522 RepID=A0A2V1AA39_9ASCO|nr:uncharacterized protein CXQ87_005196 [[Candida] duobushaemulonis]PVH14919.1 hypothetical protein CXQ87_005196 [[Candida] duobushaemulonis]
MPGRLDLTNCNELPSATASVISVSIRYSGDAAVNDYFEASSTKESIGEKTVDVRNFRGLKLVGQQMKVESHDAYLVKKNEVVCQDEDENITTSNLYHAIAKVDNVVVYGHDSTPSTNDKWTLVSEWIELSDIIHEI